MLPHFTVMSTVEPLPYFPIVFSNIRILFKGHSQNRVNDTLYHLILHETYTRPLGILLEHSLPYV